MLNKKIKRAVSVTLMILMVAGLTGCKEKSNNVKSESGEIVLHILENDTAKSEGYLDTLLNAFNKAYKEKGIQAVDANLEEFSNLAENGPYGYGPDVIYQANDKLMAYAEDKLIIPLTIEDYDCYKYIPEEAWNAFQLVNDGNAYYCGVPVNVQEPMLFYREDKMPDNWKTDWDKDSDGVADFFENWNDLYAYSEYIRDHDSSTNKDSAYGCMSSLYDLYMSANFLFSYGGYVFGENSDGTFNSKDIGFGKGDAAIGLSAMKQLAGVMNEGCIDDTIKLNRYEKVANGTYFCAISTPDTYSLFYEKLVLNYEKDGLNEADGKQKAKDNLKMVELPGKLPKNGDLSVPGSEVKDWIDNIVMGGVNGYGISAFTEHRDACMEFVNFATSYDMVKTRAQMLGIAPTRSDVAKETGGVTDMIFTSLKEGRIHLMPSVKAVDQIWTPVESMLGGVAKDAFREKNGEAIQYPDQNSLQNALDKASQDVYDAIYTLADN